MPCHKCIETLYHNLSPAATTILRTMVRHPKKEGLNLGQIVRLTGQSVSITRDALAELRGAMMVTATVRGRGIYYALAEGVADVVGIETMATGETEEVGA